MIVKTPNGTIRKEDNQYFFRGDSAGKTVIIVYKKTNNKLAEIGRRSFRVKLIPIPVFKIASGRDSMSIPEISHQQFVRAELENFDINVPYKVERFTVYIVSNDTCKAVRKNNFGSKINEEILREFQLLKPNDIVLFRNIIISDPSGTPIKLKESIVTVY